MAQQVAALSQALVQHQSGTTAPRQDSSTALVMDEYGIGDRATPENRASTALVQQINNVPLQHQSITTEHNSSENRTSNGLVRQNSDALPQHQSITKPETIDNARVQGSPDVGGSDVDTEDISSNDESQAASVERSLLPNLEGADRGGKGFSDSAMRKWAKKAGMTPADYLKFLESQGWRKEGTGNKARHHPPGE